MSDLVSIFMKWIDAEKCKKRLEIVEEQYIRLREQYQRTETHLCMIRSTYGKIGSKFAAEFQQNSDFYSTVQNLLKVHDCPVGVNVLET